MNDKNARQQLKVTAIVHAINQAADELRARLNTTDVTESDLGTIDRNLDELDQARDHLVNTLSRLFDQTPKPPPQNRGRSAAAAATKAAT